MNKKQMYNRIMEKVSIEVKNALNEKIWLNNTDYVNPKISDISKLNRIIELAELNNRMVIPVNKETFDKLNIAFLDRCDVYIYDTYKAHDIYLLVFKAGLNSMDKAKMISILSTQLSFCDPFRS